jgi:hypothetical protein
LIRKINLPKGKKTIKRIRTKLKKIIYPKLKLNDEIKKKLQNNQKQKLKIKKKNRSKNPHNSNDNSKTICMTSVPLVII